MAMTNQEVAANVKLLICDVDGVLTDGKIYIGNDGELFKAFNVKDGLGIKMLLANQIDVAILTARSSKILEKRTQELGITNVLQGQRDKVAGLKVLSEKTGVDPQNMAYIGDDLPDYAVIQKVGLRACPSDANDEIVKLCTFQSRFEGGNGAVRELAEFILKSQGKWEKTLDQMFLNPDPTAKHRY